MIIIGKNKDYYDYIVGIYGRDENIVFDRRDAILVNNTYQNSDNPLWSKKIITRNSSYANFDRKKEASKMYKWSLKNPHIDLSIPHGNLYYVGIEIGFKLYFFLVERYLDESNNVCIEPSLIEVSDIKNKINEQPINIIPYKHFLWRSFRVEPIKNNIISNPILQGTWIPKFIKAEDIYHNIYDYISSTKEKEIKDSRTDEQKAQSHGFNKESFRNPIRLKDLK